MFFCGWLRNSAPGDRWFVPLFAGFQPILLAVQDCPEASQNQGSYLGLWGPGCFPVGEAYTLSPQRGRDTMRRWVNLGGWLASGVFLPRVGDDSIKSELGEGAPQFANPWIPSLLC